MVSIREEVDFNLATKSPTPRRAGGPLAEALRRVLVAACLATLLLALPAGAQERVTGGLVTLYTFNEGEGTLVRDQSDSGPSMDLEITGSVSWLVGMNGVEMQGGRVGTAGPGSKIIERLMAAGQSSFEIWIATANLTQTGPTRMISISPDQNSRNYTLGQSADDVQARLVHSGKDSQGRPYLTTSDGFLTTGLTHLVHTYDGTTEKLFVDGVEHPASQAVSGTYANWDVTHPFSIGNEANFSRAYLGTVRLVAVYERALTLAEVQANYAASADVGPTPRVDAGEDQETSPGLSGRPAHTVTLVGTVIDNGLANPEDPVTTTWEKVAGPGTVTFGDSLALVTTADFSADGEYVLRLVADNGQSTGSDDLTVTINLVSASLTAQNTAPGDEAIDLPPNPVLEILCPSVQPMEGHWLISTDDTFSTTVYDSGPSPNYVCSHLAFAGLGGPTLYWWSARIRDDAGLWSAWSSPTRFTTLDPATLTTFSFQDGVDGYAGTSDADIRGDFQNPGTPLRDWNQGLQDVLRTGRRDHSTDEFFRSLLRFDLTSLTDSSAVAHAWLELTGWQHDTPMFFFYAPNSFHRLLRPWGEGMGVVRPVEDGEVSWTYSEKPTDWTVPGAAGEGTDRESASLMRGRITSEVGPKSWWSSEAFVEAVRDWIADPSSNHGLLWKAEAESLQKVLNLASREHADPSFRPRLVVQIRGGLPSSEVQGLLQVALDATTQRLSWQPVAGDGIGYNVYRGSLASLAAGGVYDHLPAPGVSCGLTTESFDLDDLVGGSSAYYLVVAANGVEGSYGHDSSGTPRPPSAGPCP